MKQFKALVIKDLRLYKGTLLIPLWIGLGLWALNGLAYIINLTAGSPSTLQSMFAQIPDDLPVRSLYNMISYLGGYFVAYSSGIMGLVVCISELQGGLNREYRDGCELFYRCQPVTALKFSLARFVTLFVAQWAVIVVVAGIDLLITGIIFEQVMDVRWGLYYTGMLQNWASFMQVGLVLGSFFYLTSSIFRSRAFIKTLAFLAALTVLAGILNYLYEWDLPLVLKYLFDPIVNTFDIVKRDLIANFGNQGSGQPSIQALSSYLVNYQDENIGGVIASNWKLMFSWERFGQLVASVLFFLGGTYIYRRREVR